jgi:hypothetical protein
MKIQPFYFRLITVIVIILFFLSLTLCCEKEETADEPNDNLKLATVIILPISNISYNSANIEGKIMDNGGTAIKTRGFVWSTSTNPTLEKNDGKTNVGEGTGEFTSTIEGLQQNIIYYIKAYAQNSVGVAYSEQLKFTTSEKKFAGGSGTPTDPYLIATPGQLDSIRNNKTLPYFYKQIANINLAKYNNGWVPAGKWVPIGTKENPFQGKYNGNSYKIFNLTIDLPEMDAVGLFGYTENSVLKNIIIEKINIVGNKDVGGLVGLNIGEITECVVEGEISGSGNIGGLVGWNDRTIQGCKAMVNILASGSKIGGLVGWNWNNGKIKNCIATGKVTGGFDVGGLIGESRNEISDSKAEGDIEGIAFVGGLIGKAFSTTIKFCSATGNVKANGKDNGDCIVGGLIGDSSGGDLMQCFSTGSVYGRGNYSGGLIGYNDNAYVYRCYSNEKVTGMGHYTGGLIGKNITKNQINIINKNYSLGEVLSEGDYSGGLIGYNEGDGITENFSESNVTSQGNHTGGLIGGNNGEILNCYAKGSVTGQKNAGGLIGTTYQKIINCYSAGYIKGENNYTGGLIGVVKDNALIEYCYYDKNSSGQFDTSKGIPKTTVEMKQKYTFISHWNFENIWNIDEGESYPYLRWQSQ